MTEQAIAVRDVSPGDLRRWAELYRGYREFYRLPPDEQVVERVWTWLHDDEVEVRGLVAEREGEVVGLAHWRRFHRPSSGTVGLYLDDLFTDPAARGAGVGRALVTALASRAASEGCSVVRWITAEDNAAARRLYDGVARATPWVTYDLSPER
ncbi:GNAT family N-acetyltransferase [Amnibacterium endophyticum]|uniref:GNAT family N-acetyltransferase n=1 Tax=Amnibacterium endophyticum TaxID=2109337 RepID=A0ABW4LBC3_9MICO